MAAFQSNQFNDSVKALQRFAPAPTTKRGNSVHLGAHPTQPYICYPNGKTIVVRNIENDADCFIYRGHATNTTVAKFSPSGSWVASADQGGEVSAHFFIYGTTC
jgi:WD repeat-containing protein 1 (actin-interacting protein 1)